MIVCFTDFGRRGPYMAQMRAVLYRLAPEIPVIELLADAPQFNAQAAAYLLAAYVHEFPADTVFLTVVDPGVGSQRRPLIVQADGQWFVGPDNGLFEIVARRAQACRFAEPLWRPQKLSASFHGRDLFAPLAAQLAQGKQPQQHILADQDARRPHWPDELAQVIYIDDYGNAMTGLKAASLRKDDLIAIAGQQLCFARTFSAVPQGQAFWYENANGLVEVAVNQGNAARILDLQPGTMLEIRQADS